jgi:putative SOS response-associated peptidase YedK
VCGRFTLSASGEELASQFEVPEPIDLQPRFNIAPTQDVVSVVAEGPKTRRVVAQRWGLIPFWAKDPAIGSRMINARSETVAEKKAFRDALQRRRCIVPADGFYEWSRGGASHGPHWIHPTGPGLLGFAGLWERWNSPEGQRVESCTVLTTRANGVLSPIHDRMPVILPKTAYADWLDPEAPPERLAQLYRPCPDEWLERTQVGPWVNDVRHDDRQCLEPPAQQSLF